MTFAGVNHLAVIIAALIAWLAGAGWYMVLGKVWMAAHGTTPEKMQAMRSEPGSFLPFVYAFVAELVMAWVLAGLIGVPATALLGVVVERVALTRLYQREHLDQALATFGLILFFNELVPIIRGPASVYLYTPAALSGTVELF